MTEPFIAVNPINSQNVVAGWMALEGSVISIRTRASFDGGKTWMPAVTIPHLSPEWGSADVSFAFDRAGVVYLSFIDFGRSSYGGAVALVKSLDGGMTWEPATIVHRLPDTQFRLIDRPWIAVDASSGPRSGAIYVTSMTVYTQASNRRVYLHRSEDGGRTWTSVQLDDATYPVGPYLSYGVPAVTADGQLAVAYLSDRGCGTAGATACLVVATSGDGGQSFVRRVVTPVYQPQGIRGFRFYSLAADPARPGRLALVRMDARNGDADILFRYSTDGGAAWGPDVRVNDDPLNNGVQQDIPWVTISPAGVIGVAWLDRRRSGGEWGSPFDVYLAQSEDGAIFSANRALTPAPSVDPGTTVGSTTCCNSFLGISESPAGVHAIWSDYRAGNWEVNAARTKNYPFRPRSPVRNQ
ncbi:MAG: sialidase family protein [Blastocatellia bacterium]